VQINILTHFSVTVFDIDIKLNEYNKHIMRRVW